MIYHEPPDLEYISRDEAERGRYLDTCRPIVQNAMRCRDRRILLDGPLGTGKTRVWLEKVRACCIKYPRCRWLILRSVRKWLTNSALVTWEEKVIVDGELKPDRIQRNNRSEYRFRNGSVVVVAGLDDAQGIFSAEYDGAFIVEAIEVDQDTAEKVDGRLRYGRMPYQQLLMDCNPGAPSHWLHNGFQPEVNWCTRFPMRHTDNPALVNDDGTRTKQGQDYLSRLDDLTGVRRDRLRDGRWVQAEGAIYENWDQRVHVCDPFEIPWSWHRYWAVDFGFTNPLAWLFFARDPDGRLFLYREIYQPGRLVSEVADWVKNGLTLQEPMPEAIVTDHDPEAQGQIEKVIGMPTTPAKKDSGKKKVGIQYVADRLNVARDGRPRLQVFKGALCHEPVRELYQAGKPTCTEQEFETYVWDPKKKKGEEPLDENNHGMDATRYLVHFLDEGFPVEGAYTPHSGRDPFHGMRNW